ncbi:MAG: hypothetical protein KGJ92_08605 [Actinomycetales bacterium]|nr:hypothetical protein [Actinomycetales bacterium]
MTSPRAARYALLEPAPRRRADIRRAKQRWSMVGIGALAVPFAAAVIVIGVVH